MTDLGVLPIPAADFRAWTSKIAEERSGDAKQRVEKRGHRK
jgi:hypothetical protein